MLERHLFELEFSWYDRRMIQQVVPQYGVRMERRAIIPVEVRQVDYPLQRAQLVNDPVDLVLADERLAAVLVPVHVEQYLRAQLGKAIQHSARAEVRPATGPDRPHAR